MRHPMLKERLQHKELYIHYRALFFNRKLSDNLLKKDAAASDVTIDESAATASGYNCYSASFPVTYEGDYKDIPLAAWITKLFL